MNKKELAKRTISGVILGPIVVFSFLTYPTLLGLVTAIVMISSFELIEMFTSCLLYTSNAINDGNVIRVKFPTPTVAVSYTHLDVYKRQEINCYAIF